MIDGNGLWRLIEARAAETPDALMAVDANDREITFEQYRDAALRSAMGLTDLGLGPDDRVSWMLPTCIESIVLIAALARLGAVQNPILPSYRAREVDFIVNQSRPKLLVTPSSWRGFDYAEMAREISAKYDNLQTLIVDGALPETEAQSLPPPPEQRPPNGQPVRWLFYSSGTTSDPKGALHTDASLWAAARGMGERLALSASDRIAMVFPLTHIGGLNWLQAGLSFGCTLILIENFADESTIPALRRHGVTLGTAGTVFHEAYLKAHRECEAPPLFPRVRAFPGGGAPKPPQLHADLKREMGGVGILSGYGMTEAPILSMGGVDDPDEKLARTEGRPALPDVDLRVVGNDGQPMAPGAPGEFRVRAPQLFRGYLDEALNDSAFDKEGYFRTGDLGFLDEDGYVVVTGRRKDVIIRNGENISAGEIEDLLYEHPDVIDVAVIGLPDARTGERCCAVVACRDPKLPLDMNAMRDFLRTKQLMTQKIPEQLEIISAIPRNPTGKILKDELRRRYSK